MLGMKRSRIEKVAAATRARVNTSSRDGFFEGIIQAAIATTEPSRMYLRTRTASSFASTEKLILFYIIFNKKIILIAIYAKHLLMFIV
jgi:hypothetical protein